MAKDGQSPNEGEPGLQTTRREFAAVAAGASLFQTATATTVADEMRETPRATGEELADANQLEEAFTPSDWLVVGPFQYQFPENGTDGLFPNGGEPTFADGTQQPAGGQLFQSAFAAGASVEWEQVRLDDGQSTVPLDLADNVDPTGGDIIPLFGAPGLTDDFQDWFGLGGVLFATGYAYTTFTRDRPTVAVLETSATAWVNGRKIDETPTAVPLQAGRNFVLLKQSLTLGGGAASIRFRPATAPVEFKQGTVLPDLRRGETTDQPAAFELVNTGATPVEEATLTIDSGEDGPVATRTVDIDPPLAPFESRWVGTRIQTKGAVTEAHGTDVASTEVDSRVPEMALSTVEMARQLRKGETPGTLGTDGTMTADVRAASQTGLTATVSTPDGEASRRVDLDIRGPDDPRQRYTFESAFDEAVSEFAVLRPTNVDSDDGPWELLMSLHGAGVPPLFNINGTKQLEDTYVMAPAARLGYNHEGLGRKDDLEALAVTKERFDIDEHSVYLSGHSMGGHGTWHVGLTNSDEFAALGPSAAWIDIPTYIIAPFGRDELYTYPGLKRVKEAALYRRSLAKTENALDGNLSVFQLQGGADTVVPPLLPRTFARSLADQGLRVRGEVGTRYSRPDPDAVDVAYLEVPGQEHFWDAGIADGGADALSHPDLLGYLRQTTRELPPERVRFFTTNLGVEYQKYWVAVIQQRQVHAPTRVIAEVRDGTVHVETENVVTLALDRAAIRSLTGRRGATTVQLNGSRVQLPARGPPTDYEFDIGEDPVVLDVSQGTVSAGGGRQPYTKTPPQYGPLRQIHHRPYRLVYGTQGSEAETQQALALANLRSQNIGDRARAPGIVVPDTAVDEAMQQAYNLVLFGRPSTNAVLATVDGSQRVPLSVGEGSVTISTAAGSQDSRPRTVTYEGDLGVEYVYPNPNAPDRLVQVSTGTSRRGLELTGVRDWVYPQRATADYKVFDETVRSQRWNSARAAGFFDTEWEVTERNGYLR